MMKIKGITVDGPKELTCLANRADRGWAMQEGRPQWYEYLPDIHVWRRAASPTEAYLGDWQWKSLSIAGGVFDLQVSPPGDLAVMWREENHSIFPRGFRPTDLEEDWVEIEVPDDIPLPMEVA